MIKQTLDYQEKGRRKEVVEQDQIEEVEKTDELMEGVKKEAFGTGTRCDKTSQGII